MGNGEDGGGGKYSAGKLGDEDDAMALDPRDPNYDPDESGQGWSRHCMNCG